MKVRAVKRKPQLRTPFHPTVRGSIGHANPNHCRRQFAVNSHSHCYHFPFRIRRAVAAYPHLSSLFPFPRRAIPFHETYYNVVEGLEEAISHAGNGGDCSVYQW